MTLEAITLNWTQICDYCGELCYVGEVAYWNPKTKNVYHLDVCYEKAEAG